MLFIDVYIYKIIIKDNEKIKKKGKKMKNNKGFTLIELLVVVAIIGILAAVGVVAYNGYTAAAKKNASKTIHANVVKFIASETKKCSLDAGASILKDNTGANGMSCSDYADSVAVATAGKDVSDHIDTTYVGTIIVDKNPFKPTVTTTTDDGAGNTTSSDGPNYAVGGEAGNGATVLTDTENNITVTTTYDTGKTLVDTITLE